MPKPRNLSIIGASMEKTSKAKLEMNMMYAIVSILGAQMNFGKGVYSSMESLVWFLRPIIFKKPFFLRIIYIK